MTKKKKSSSEVIKKILSNETYNSIVETLEELLPIDKHDYEGSKKYYDDYVKILYKLAVCEEDKLEELKEEIEDNNPWKEALEDSKQYRSIADSDRSILEPLIEEEINNFKDNIFSEKMREPFSDEVSTIYSQYGGEEEFNNAIKENLAKPFFKQIFSDFEHVFDGNFENPRVIILGINPRLNEIKHPSYKLSNVYRNPFNSRRPTLYSEKDAREKDKYYFIPNGFFFMKTKKYITPNKIKEDFLHQITSREKDTPYALWEFFPYATNSENEWFDEISISEKKITKYIQQKNFLPSQIWLLCLLTFTIKKALFDSKRDLYIFCTKKEKTFQKAFIKPYFEDLLKITPTSNVKILLKKDDRNRSFNVNNITPYFKTPETVFRKNAFKKFYKVIWNIQ